MSDGEFLVIAALIRKLGGDVTITDQEIQEAMEMEVLKCESQDFFWNTRYKVRPKPVTIQGQPVSDGEQAALPQANLLPHIEHLESIVTEHVREVIAVHDGYGEEAWCPACRERWPCEAAAVQE